MIIALTGPAGCGKSTAAAHLAEAHGFARVRFAGPLKAMLRAFLAETGAPPEIVERMIEGDLKEVPSSLLVGRSPRYAMQRLGTEFGREMMGAALWTSAWEAGACAALARGAPGVVVEDCRFPNEAEAVRGLGGRLVRIERPVGAKVLAPHASEGQDLPSDIVLRNDGTSEVLHARLDGALRRFEIRAVA